MNSDGTVKAIVNHQQPPDVSSDWWSAVQEKIRKSEYNVTWQEKTYLPDATASWQAPNRAHNLRTYFTKAGFQVIPRSSDIPAWRWGLSLVSFGFAGNSGLAEKAAISVNDNRVEYKRKGLTEWYINDPKGLEQGFTLYSAPESISGDAVPCLSLKQEIHGDLKAILNDSSDQVEFITPGGVCVILLSKLNTIDAVGKKLPTKFAIADNLLEILVDTTDATYPIIIDPLATTPAWTADSGQAGARLGCSVSTAGDVNGDGYSDVVIGAEYYDNGDGDSGRIFTYHGSYAGLRTQWSFSAYSTQSGALFGCSVSTAGDVNGDGYSDVIVGSEAFDTAGGVMYAGRAYVFRGSASGLSMANQWWATPGNTNEHFGCSVSTAGDVNGDGYSDIIVGAEIYGQIGKAYVYYGSDEGLIQWAAPDWTDVGSHSAAHFGRSVGTAGDVNGDGFADIIVGSAGSLQGVSVYYGSSKGLAMPAVANWTAGSIHPNDGFGSSVGTAGDVNGDGYADIVIGAPSSSNDAGWAYVYHGSSSGLIQDADPDWAAESDQADSRFGVSVRTAGDVNGDGYADVIVGASRYSSGESDEGRIFVYYGNPSGLSASPDWTAEPDQTNADMGVSVSTAGDVNGDGYSDVIAGATGYNSSAGRAFVYHGSAGGLSTSDNWSAASGQAGSHYGIAVNRAGDVNGDGYDDVIVGASQYDAGKPREGRAYVYHGSASGLNEDADWIGESDHAGANYGYSVSTAGDVNGDGYSDVIVGAWGYANPQTGEGRAFVYYGSSEGLRMPSVADWTAESNQSNAYFGISVSTAGDVNGDGYSDVIIGADWYDNGDTDEGRAYVFYGSSEGLIQDAPPDWTAEADASNASFGHSVGTAGDVNRDGYSDIIIGAWGYSDPEAGEGKAYVFHGSSAGLIQGAAPDWTAESNQEFASFGRSVGTAGDVNGDGYSDIIVGAEHYSGSEAQEGWVFVYYGSNSGLSESPDWTAESDQEYARFGSSVSTAGDVNGDGYSDIIVGADWYDSSATNEGRAYVFLGSAAGLIQDAEADWMAESDQSESHFGRSVSTAGDVNGDGYADVIVGSHGYPDPGENAGRAFVYYGNNGVGLSLTHCQRQANDIAPIDLLGMSGRNQFQLSLLGRTPYGRGDVKLEWEIKPLGSHFNGSDTQVSEEWMDTEITGAAINEVVADLADGGVYHWRMRLLYHPVTTPFQQHSRWIASAVNGFEEADLRFNDGDGDGLSDMFEEAIGTDPDDADSDNDNITDGDEYDYWGTDWDTDFDGDAATYPNNLLDPDSDGDGFIDGTEVTAGTDPADPNSIPQLVSVPIFGSFGFLITIFTLLFIGIRKKTGSSFFTDAVQ